MDYVKIAGEFITAAAGGIYIKNVADGSLLYADETVKGLYPDLTEGAKLVEYMDWEDSDTEEYSCQDIYDLATKKFFLVRSKVVNENDAKVKVVNLVDITEIMQLSKDMAKTVKYYKELDKFKSQILEKASESYYAMLPVIQKYVLGKDARILRKYHDITECYSYNTNTKSFEKCYIKNTVDLFDMEQGQKVGGGRVSAEGEFECVVAGHIGNSSYLLLNNLSTEMTEAATGNSVLMQDIKVYIENALMKEEIIYESEHDKMTGLYNKGKYLERYNNEYKNLDSIGIFNYDVNYLKQTNDNLGHEAGDELLKRAAESIRYVCSEENIHGYRMGGDEYLLIVENHTKEEVMAIKDKWEKGINEMNEKADDFPCIMAVGVVYGEKGYDFDALMHEADGLMYEDKKRKKKPGEEIR